MCGNQSPYNLPWNLKQLKYNPAFCSCGNVRYWNVRYLTYHELHYNCIYWLSQCRPHDVAWWHLSEHPEISHFAASWCILLSARGPLYNIQSASWTSIGIYTLNSVCSYWFTYFFASDQRLHFSYLSHRAWGINEAIFRITGPSKTMKCSLPKVTNISHALIWLFHVINRIPYQKHVK